MGRDTLRNDRNNDDPHPPSEDRVVVVLGSQISVMPRLITLSIKRPHQIGANHRHLIIKKAPSSIIALST